MGEVLVDQIKISCQLEKYLLWLVKCVVKC